MPLPILRAAALAAALLPATWAAAATLSLDQALELAVQRSQSARAARAGALGAAQMARAAGQQPDPMLSIGLDNLPVTGGDRFSTSAADMTMKRIGIAQEWVSADKRAAREAAAGAQHRREALMEALAAADTRLQTALAYIDAHFAGEALQLSTLNERHAREELAVAKGRLASLTGNPAEVLGLSSALGAAEDLSAETRQQQAAATAALQRWIGLSVDTTAGTTASTSASTSANAPADQPALTAPNLAVAPNPAAYVAAHPAVLTRQRDIDVARRDVDLARLNRQPNWRYELSYGQRAGRPDLMSFGVSIPLPIAPEARQDRETAARQALADKAEADAEEARRAAAGDYAALASDAQALQQRIARFQAAVLLPLQQRTATTLAAYRGNQASLVMLFEARHAELEAQRRLLSLQRDLARTQAQLVFKPITQGVTP